MTMTLPTRTDLITELQSYLQARLPDIVVTTDSDVGARIAMLADAVLGLHYQLRAIEDDMFVSDRTSTEALEQHAEARFGPGARKGATTASGAAALRVRGTSLAAVSAGLILRSTDGVRYQISKAAIVGASPNTWVDCDVEALDAGLKSNRDVGELLTFEEPPASLQSTAELVLALTGGTDAESDAELGNRIKLAYRSPPAGGRASDYRQWAEAITGVTRAYVYVPNSAAVTGRRGYGTVDIAILGPGQSADRAPSEAVRLAVVDAVEARRPAGARDFTVIVPTPLSVSIKMQLVAKPGYGPDFAQAGSVQVLNYNAGTRTLRISEQTTNAAAGHRIIVRGQLKTIIAVGSQPDPLGAAITVDSDFSVTPEADDDVWPGSPLSEPARDALAAYIDSFGPARGVNTADPNDIDWRDHVHVSHLYRAVMALDGVSEASVITLAAPMPGDYGSYIEFNTYAADSFVLVTV